MNHEITTTITLILKGRLALARALAQLMDNAFEIPVTRIRPDRGPAGEHLGSRRDCRLPASPWGCWRNRYVVVDSSHQRCDDMEMG